MVVGALFFVSLFESSLLPSRVSTDRNLQSGAELAVGPKHSDVGCRHPSPSVICINFMKIGQGNRSLYSSTFRVISDSQFKEKPGLV